MKTLRVPAILPTLFVFAALLVGCGHKEGDGHDHGKEEAHGKDDGHGHEEESPSGASFKAGKGVVLTDETRGILGVEIADVGERRLPNLIRFTVQIFGEKHHPQQNPDDHSGCDVHGSGFVSTNIAAYVKAGQPVELLVGTNVPLAGVVLGVHKALALDEAEIVVATSNATAVLKSGEFARARINLPRNEAVVAIPQAALLRTSEGTFVYAVNGDAYFRTAVKIGTEADDWVEITDGLLDGDQVVTQPVQTLWLIELRATKGGGHSH
jgi:hypothetical protein